MHMKLEIHACTRLHTLTALHTTKKLNKYIWFLDDGLHASRSSYDMQARHGTSSQVSMFKANVHVLTKAFLLVFAFRHL
jgi:hypothetical protein